MPRAEDERRRQEAGHRGCAAAQAFLNRERARQQLEQEARQWMRDFLNAYDQIGGGEEGA